MKILSMLLVFLLIAPNILLAERRERYRSRTNYGDNTSATTPNRRAQRNQNSNRYDRYKSKSNSERQQFDRNLNRYNRYSPSEKRNAQRKWKSFKQRTTPEERKYIRQKYREADRPPRRRR